jgi:multidrug efflux pump subunit AcrA (membrane-fusion protein)
VLVELPVAERSALLVPASAVETRSGIDFVRIAAGGTKTERAVVTGERTKRADGDYVEILTGLATGDVVVTP